MRNVFKYAVPLALAIVMIVMTSTVEVHAATAHEVAGAGNEGVTFTVRTGRNVSGCKLVFSQAKGNFAYTNVLTGTSYYKGYGRFCIYVQENGGGSKSYRCSYKSSTTIALKSNTTYTVSVVPTERQFVHQHFLETGKLKGSSFLGWDYGVGHWSAYPTWKISTKATISADNIQRVWLNDAIY